ncbi:hypothetical protein [Saccharomonospora piscinae]|uniref:Uncharacterized protein n=1 Tax=Saccharomonospora piscinae TaxID=687388 RepID=A0A1V9ACD8_SACPI|nr:hypothetical protein [Saccharomonospora piscinae]OQO94743.1 hypothetical protein B1813_01205 [Saccharomonospora piscinae]TLW94551.1 hypothetical protein FFT09_01255 [Saccharomonospora piscinae]
MTGFFTSNDELGDIGASVDLVESDVRAVADSWTSDAADGAAAFATAESADAFTQLQRSIATMLSERGDELGRIAERIRDGRSAYQRVEDTVTETVDGIIPDNLGDILGGRW